MSMTIFFIIALPMLVVTGGVLAVPLLAMPDAELSRVTDEFEQHRERHRLAHEARGHDGVVRPR
jgi:hypothetical protein